MITSKSLIQIELPLKGGCQCNSIRYEVTVLPKTLYACYCMECQRQSSAGFGMSMPVERVGFRLTNGQPGIWKRSAASGRVVGCAFCSQCGTRLYHAPERNQAIVNIKPGTLDDTSWIAPVGHLWVASAQSWIKIPQGELIYSGQPESFDDLFQVWRERLDSHAI